jgi:predicted dehydrogenase
MAPVQLGVIGANPDRGWALSAHLPALQSLGGQEFAVRAVSTRRMETAQRAASLFGAPAAYDDYTALLADPGVEAVTVAVKLPHHHEIVSAALAAGKHVFCEWPLGRTVDEAADLAAKAKASAVHSMIGLQARASPELAHLRGLIESGYLGELRSVTVVASGFGWGDAIDADQIYLFDRSSGATMLSVTGGHLMDAVQMVCGELTALSSVLATRTPRVAVLSMDELARRRRYDAVLDFEGKAKGGPNVIPVREAFAPTAPDQVLVAGVLENGAPISIHIRGGSLRGSGLLIELTGSDGELRVTAPAGVIQMMPLKLFGARGAAAELKPLTPPGSGEADALAALSPIAANVGRLYRAFAADIRSGRRSVPDFDLALTRHRMLAAIEAADTTGARQSLPAN